MNLMNIETDRLGYLPPGFSIKIGKNNILIFAK